jgi:hypothetical protein
MNVLTTGATRVQTLCQSTYSTREIQRNINLLSPCTHLHTTLGICGAPETAASAQSGTARCDVGHTSVAALVVHPATAPICLTDGGLDEAVICCKGQLVLPLMLPLLLLVIMPSPLFAAALAPAWILQTSSALPVLAARASSCDPAAGGLLLTQGQESAALLPRCCREFEREWRRMALDACAQYRHGLWAMTL